MIRVPVLVVGAGSVGLTTTVLLAEHGVTAMAVDRREGPSPHPRATGLHERAWEILRAVGLQDRLSAELSTLPRTGGVVSVSGPLATADLDEADWTANRPGTPRHWAALSPVEPTTACPQDRLDPMLLDAARQRGATVSYDTEIVDLDQNATGVIATCADGRTIHADYVVVADGARSRTRDRLGIGTTGPGELGGNLLNILFRADLGDLVGDPAFALCSITTPETSGILMQAGVRDRWLFHLVGSEDRPAEDFPSARCPELLRQVIGVPDLDVTVLGTAPWCPTARIAERFRSGRAFLVGDAARVVPPTGGFGLNTGIGDAYNLAWKLAAVVDGRAGAGLLDSYAEERYPVARSVLEQSLIRSANRELHWNFGPDAAAERQRVGMVHLPVVILGSQYDSGAVLGGRTTFPSTEDTAACLDGHPGTRLPHLWLDDGRTSTLDLVRDRFTLFVGPRRRWDELDECEALGPADWLGTLDGVALRVHRLERHSALGIRADGAVLVRPDDVIAWRDTGDGTGPGPREALGHLLHGSRPERAAS